MVSNAIDMSSPKSGLFESAPSLEISDSDYRFVRDLIYKHSRIHLDGNRKHLVVSRLSRRLRQLNLKDCNAYCRLLRSPEGGEEVQKLVDSISTNFTFFFREQKHFDFLTQVVLPSHRDGARAGGAGPFRIWSSACATGEEPLSMALLLADTLGCTKSADWRVEATDISTAALETAKRGVYSEESLTLPKPEWLSRYFQKGVGQWAGKYRTKNELLERISYRQMNLIESPVPFPTPVNVIFCRNVMIYFDRKTQEQLIRRLVGCLTQGGYLIIGHTENLTVQPQLTKVQHSIYKRIA